MCHLSLRGFALEERRLTISRAFLAQVWALLIGRRHLRITNKNINWVPDPGSHPQTKPMVRCEFRNQVNPI